MKRARRLQQFKMALGARWHKDLLGRQHGPAWTATPLRRQLIFGNFYMNLVSHLIVF
jgi:hypothetical protein